MKELRDLLLERIERSGPIPFAAFMAQALYEPGLGYYSTRAARTDWSGHYLTSPELDPGYGELWMKVFAGAWAEAGRPARFDIVEVGPGEGGFARAVLDAAPGDFAHALRYLLVERSVDARGRQAELLGDDERVSWIASITDIQPVENGVVYMNEVIDNLPVHLVERRGDRLVELHVGAKGNAFELRDGPASAPQVEAYLERLGIDIPNGHRFEIGLAAENLLARTAAALLRGLLVIVDYGAEAEDLAQRPSGTLVCYSAAGVDDLPLQDPGAKDITVHANWTSLRGTLVIEGLSVVGPAPQRAVLRGLGVDEMDARLRAEFTRASGEGRGADGLRALSRRQALGALVDPGGLGSLGVMVGARGIAPPRLSA